ATHPLVGRLWSTAASEFADVEALRAQLLASRFVLLGEKHDNPDHHRLQAWAIEALVAGGRRPAVVLEMLNADQAGRLAAYLAKPAPTPEGLGAAVGWGERGWPDWSLYQPIAAAALQAGLPLSAGDFGAAARDTVLRDGLDGLPADER